MLIKTFIGEAVFCENEFSKELLRYRKGKYIDGLDPVLPHLKDIILIKGPITSLNIGQYINYN